MKEHFFIVVWIAVILFHLVKRYQADRDIESKSRQQLEDIGNWKSGPFPRCGPLR